MAQSPGGDPVRWQWLTPPGGVPAHQPGSQSRLRGGAGRPQRWVNACRRLPILAPPGAADPPQRLAGWLPRIWRRSASLPEGSRASSTQPAQDNASTCRDRRNRKVPPPPRLHSGSRQEFMACTPARSAEAPRSASAWTYLEGPGGMGFGGGIIGASGTSFALALRGAPPAAIRMIRRIRLTAPSARRTLCRGDSAVAGVHRQLDH